MTCMNTKLSLYFKHLKVSIFGHLKWSTIGINLLCFLDGVKLWKSFWSLLSQSW